MACGTHGKLGQVAHRLAHVQLRTALALDAHADQAELEHAAPAAIGVDDPQSEGEPRPPGER